MPVVKADKLTHMCAVLLEASGASKEEAMTVSSGCVAANLAGHDSHGVIAIPTYIDRVEKKHIIPNAPFTIVQESPTTTVVDGNWGFGFVVADKAMKLTIEKAEKQNVAATTILRQSHVGRVGAYPLMAAKAGMIAIMTADSGRSPKAVAPFGGAAARLGTNPISIAIPSDLAAPFCLDMATSAVAAGKIKLAQARNAEIPEGWVLDSQGRPTKNPFDFDKGGVLLPVGGSEGYKGYGLSAMVEILSALLPGLGFGVEPSGRHNDGCFLACFKVSAFRDVALFKREVKEFAEYLKATPPQPGIKEVLYPGEVEWRSEQARLKDGVPIEDATWKKLLAVGEKYKVSDKLGV
jgi:uncharacterized oxidoreductase